MKAPTPVLTLCPACRDGLIHGEACSNCGAEADLYVGSEFPLVAGGQGKEPEEVKDSAAIVAFAIAGLWGVIVGYVICAVTR